KYCPALKEFVARKTKLFLDNKEWIIEICGNDVKKMVDPVIERIIQLARLQLKNCNDTCSAIFMERIRKEFKNDVRCISVPPEPASAIVNGAVVYGLRTNTDSSQCNVKMPFSKPIILNRVLKYTYGTDVLLSNEFSILANRG
ncbi:18399_t:CDS:2, partial [Racocetra persica]